MGMEPGAVQWLLLGLLLGMGDLACGDDLEGGESLACEGDGREYGSELDEPREGGWEGEHFWGGELFLEGSRGVGGRCVGKRLLPSGLKWTKELKGNIRDLNLFMGAIRIIFLWLKHIKLTPTIWMTIPSRHMCPAYKPHTHWSKLNACILGHMMVVIHLDPIA